MSRRDSGADQGHSVAMRLWCFAGSYGVGLVLMLILLVLTFAGTLHEVRMAPQVGMEVAIESFFGAPWVLIPLWGEMLALPLPGMGIICVLLFINILIGGVIRIRRTRANVGVIVTHVGILLLLGSIMLGGRMTVTHERVELPQGERVQVQGLPFDLRLNQFTPEFYPGTDKPKSFESLLTVYPRKGGEFDAAVRMNEPLRMQGWTFYQMSYGMDALHDGRPISILRAYHNPLEQMPKWSSYLIAVGLIWHFSLVFARYLHRKTRPDAGQGAEDVSLQVEPCSPPVKTRSGRRLFAVVMLILLVFGIGMMAARPSVKLAQVQDYYPWPDDIKERIGAMAVQDGGRLKPVSTYAGFQLLRVLGKRSFSIDTPKGKVKLTPLDWMLDCIFRQDLADQYPVFLVNREDVVRKLNLPPQADKRKKYTYAQLEAHWDDIARAVNEIRNLGGAELSDMQKEIVALSRNMDVVSGWRGYKKIALFAPSTVDNYELPRWFCRENADGSTAWTAAPPEKSATFLMAISMLENKELGKQEQKSNAVNAGTIDILQKFLITPNETVVQTIGARDALNREIFYYRLDPLYLALATFIAAFVCLVICSIFKTRSGDKIPWWRGMIRPGGMSSAWVIGAVGALALVGALVIRAMITMRSPVGNTYETIAFIACMGVICALVAELFSKKGIVLASGLLLGAFACQMGIMYEGSQAVDHMDPLVAILRSNFLLSTHVITIVLGYAAGLLASVLSHVYLIGAPLKLTERKTMQSLDRIAYGMLCFSLVFTLIGTVFGGIWGNESWGRFWGWDPKENGALMIVLWQLCVLHARKAGWLNSWALHFCNALCGIIIAFAWWGVNMLGVGLHSYGFTDAQHALTIFYWAEAALCVVFIAMRLTIKDRV